jgi:flagellar biosynthesis protein FlhF
MHVETFRARSMPEALQLVRRTLGPDAAVLQTREVSPGLFRWLSGARLIEVVASADVPVPSRFPETAAQVAVASGGKTARAAPPFVEDDDNRLPDSSELDYRTRFRNSLDDTDEKEPSLVEDLCRISARTTTRDLPDGLFQLYQDLIEAEISEESARELLETVRQASSSRELSDPVQLKARAARLLEAEFRVSGPIRVEPPHTRVVALVGPTGVGKTTTLAKLAASYRLRERRRVGLITVDTYRLAAVEQLRTYADIIDLPMEVVSTPREMRLAVDRLSGLDLILMDTAGRSPRDEVRLQELKSLLADARADEVHLVLSSVASLASLRQTAERFASVGLTALLLTKLDEATGLGHLLPLVRSCRLPLSYVTHGQNVPDDIEPANSKRLVRSLLRMEP